MGPCWIDPLSPCLSDKVLILKQDSIYSVLFEKQGLQGSVSRNMTLF
jgi:hypothetical protein